MSIMKEITSRHCGQTSFLQLKKKVLVKRCKEFSLDVPVEIEPVHTLSVNCLDCDKSGRYLLSGGKDGSLFIHDLFNFTGRPSYKCKVILGFNEYTCVSPTQSVETVQWFPFDAGMFISSGMDGLLRIWDTNRMTVVETIQFNHKIYQHHMSTTPMGSAPMVAVASRINQVRLVDMRSGQHTHELRGHTSSVMCCAWSPTSAHFLATGSCDATIRLWDTRAAKNFLGALDYRNRDPSQSRTNLTKAHNGFVNGIAFSPNGRLLMSIGTDNELRCWDLHSKKNREIVYGSVPNSHKNRALKFQIFGYENLNMCFVPSENYIAIYEIETGRKLSELWGHYSIVNSCYFQEDRMELYSGGQDRNILCWTLGPRFQ